MHVYEKNEHLDAYSKAEQPLNLNTKSKTTTSTISYLTLTRGTMLNVSSEENDSKIRLIFKQLFEK